MCVLRELEKQGHALAALFANTEIAIVMLGESTALQQMHGNMIKHYSDGSTLNVMFETVIDGVIVRWCQHYDNCFALPFNPVLAEVRLH